MIYVEYGSVEEALAGAQALVESGALRGGLALSGVIEVLARPGGVWCVTDDTIDEGGELMKRWEL